MKKMYHLNTLLAITLFVALMAMIITRTFFPAVILPQANIPNLVLISLVALLLECYLAPGADRCYICIPLFAAVAFGLLPYVAGMTAGMEIVKLAFIGALVFTAVTWIFTSMTDRLSSGPAAKAAPLFSALGIYLASQALTGMIL